MAPMKLYGSTMSWNMTRSALALEEAGADYEIVPINFATAEHKSPEHLARNPFDQVPALQDSDLYVWESRAICKYAARKHKPELLKAILRSQQWWMSGWRWRPTSTPLCWTPSSYSASSDLCLGDPLTRRLLRRILRS
ncbi:hypothetical protein PVAP13_5NG510300 [Panicum virgatum]|uniref:glutathione transferase n=1 Tax=Panicum virgatum TaxID=38727 RepID=A0A8T0RZM8_PANVG|nr:hypothetical protein PVAP13_5NG510300 [Panicum virgatum]